MKHPSPRLIVAATALTLLGGTAAVASAAPSNKTHVVCLINQDAAADSTQHGLCLVVDDPATPKLPTIPTLPTAP